LADFGGGEGCAIHQRAIIGADDVIDIALSVGLSLARVNDFLFKKY